VSCLFHYPHEQETDVLVSGLVFADFSVPLRWKPRHLQVHYWSFPYTHLFHIKKVFHFLFLAYFHYFCKTERILMKSLCVCVCVRAYLSVSISVCLNVNPPEQLQSLYALFMKLGFYITTHEPT
jgi:hypothetical protein